MKRKTTWFAITLAALLAACNGDHSNNSSSTTTMTAPSAQFVATVVTEVGTASARPPDDISTIVVGTSDTALPIDISNVTVGM